VDPERWAIHRPRATKTSPRKDIMEMFSPSSQDPRIAAVTGLRAKKTVTFVGDVWFKAHSQR
jgi:hypothetical protein